MTTKIQAIISGALAGVFSFISYLAIAPPEVQSGFFAQLVEITPVQHRPFVAVTTKALATIFGFYATYKAAHSGPQSPPKNPPE